MENRLLLINKRREVIEEFTQAYAGEQFQIDVATSGLEGYKKLQASSYKLVVMGMIYPDVDGNKLLAYIRKSFPQTKCIVYTTKISVGQIAYLTNRMHVFRIFLRPADYKGEMLSSIQEAFGQYDIAEANKERRKEEQEDVDRHKQRYQEMKQRELKQEEADTLLLRIFDPILRYVSEQEDGLSEVEREQILEMEQDVIERYLKENRQPVNGLPTVEVKLRHYFFEGMPDRSLRLHTDSTVVQLADSFVERMYICIWILIYRVTLLTKCFDAYVDIEFETSTRLNVRVSFQLPAGVWDAEESMPISRKITRVHESIVKNMCEKFRRSVDDIQVSYYLGFDAGKDPVFEVQ